METVENVHGLSAPCVSPQANNTASETLQARKARLSEMLHMFDCAEAESNRLQIVSLLLVVFAPQTPD